MGNSSEVAPLKLWTVLAKCHHALRRVAESSICDAGLGLSDFAVLEALLHKGPLTISEIQDKVLLASGSMTAAIDRVERKGLVVRTTTPKDRRARVLELTDEGRRLIGSAHAHHAADFAELMRVLDPGEQEQLYRLSKKLGLAAAGQGAREHPAKAQAKGSGVAAEHRP